MNCRLGFVGVEPGLVHLHLDELITKPVGQETILSCILSKGNTIKKVHKINFLAYLRKLGVILSQFKRNTFQHQKIIAKSVV